MLEKRGLRSARKPVSKRKREVRGKSELQPSFGAAIRFFISQIEGLSRATDMTVKTVTDGFKKEAERFDSFMREKRVRAVDKKGSETYRIKPEDLAGFERHHKALLSSLLALRNVPRIFLCSLVHHYDAYLGRLLRVAFFVKPELPNASQRQLSFTELLVLGSMEAAREYIVEKEVETVIRDSHTGHFEWMENRFGLTLRKDLTVWPQFVEITERRNLFVHRDGVVSSQYLSVCQKEGVALDPPVKIGDELDVSEDYFRQAVECILEIGVKLGHVLWRKLQPECLADADGALLVAAYDLLTEERYSLVKTLLHFAVDTLKKQSSEEIRRINLINLAIAHSFSGERPQALALLKAHDWSASEDRFKLAVAVLEHRYDEAVQLMRRIGAKGSVTRLDYSSWPLFKEFRHRTEFLAAYRELFGEEFVLPKSGIQEKKKKARPASSVRGETRRR